ncbi:lipoyl synthase [Desulforhopalus sp. IMCC35007]|uniref:lipoyl synthase n=1 Tax=Desulforhopalus sp. IMCC35007 TaxID=2569543 RepID=UPI0010AE0815|nr:lipoyl synthase [Desulforhopalus sp. IMCC35007]TKB12115.1 lipoyl synthase [Desulforhopalus sp. IMCC35007]
MTQCNNKIRVGKPKWLRRTLPTGPEYENIRKLLKNHSLTTVCQEAKCPNQFECYGEGTATFMILGEKCTRNCRFCAVGHPPESLPDPEEPARVAEAVVLLKLRYAVVTSVTRDDLADGGASLFVKTIEAIRRESPETLIEVLIPDLQGNWQALRTIVEARPDVLNHNVETISRLYPEVRPQAIYSRSLELLKKVKEMAPGMVTKSGLMVGLGETMEELTETWRDILASGTDILTIGQYLQPSAEHLEVQRFIPPEEFDIYTERAKEDGFTGVASGAFVRSSYKAEALYRKAAKAIEV